MTSKIDPDGLVSAGRIPSPGDLETARALGWYRIPLGHAPNIVQVDDLAFCQTGAFPQSHQWMVEFVAGGKGAKIYRRSQLFAEESNQPSADEEHDKIQIGDQQALDRPILAGTWKMLSFLYPAGSKRFSTPHWSEVPARNRYRNMIRKSLQERAGKYGWNIPEKPIHIDGAKEVWELLKMLTGSKKMSKNITNHFIKTQVSSC